MDALLCLSNNGHHFEQVMGEALVTGDCGSFYGLLPWEAAGCESPEGVGGKDHLRSRKRWLRARIQRPTSADVPNQRPAQRAVLVIEYDQYSCAIFCVQRLIGLGKGAHQSVEQRIEEFWRAESWPFNGVADLLVVNPVFAVVACHIQPDRSCVDTGPPDSFAQLMQVRRSIRSRGLRNRVSSTHRSLARFKNVGNDSSAAGTGPWTPSRVRLSRRRSSCSRCPATSRTDQPGHTVAAVHSGLSSFLSRSMRRSRSWRKVVRTSMAGPSCDTITTIYTLPEPCRHANDGQAT